MKKIFLVFVIMVFCSADITREGYSLIDCYAKSVSVSETLMDQQEQLFQAEERYHQAASNLLPNISGLVTYTKQDPNGAGSQADSTTAKLTLSQPIFKGFKLINTLKQNETLVALQKEAYAWAGMQLYSDVAQSYFLVCYLEHDKQLIEEQKKLFSKRLQELNERMQIGRSRKTEIISFEVSIAQLNTQIMQVENQLKSARGVIGFLVGEERTLKLADEKEITYDLKEFDYYFEKINNRPDVKAAKHKVEAAKIVIEITQANELMPNVDLNTSYYLQHSSPLSNVAWDAQVALTLPVFVGVNNASKTKEAVSVKTQADIAYAKILRQAKQNIEDMLITLRAEKAQIEMSKKAVELSEKNVKTVVQDYRLGLSNNLDVLQAMNSFIDIKRSLNKLKYAYKTDYAKLLSAIAEI